MNKEKIDWFDWSEQDAEYEESQRILKEWDETTFELTLDESIDCSEQDNDDEYFDYRYGNPSLGSKSYRDYATLYVDMYGVRLNCYCLKVTMSRVNWSQTRSITINFVVPITLEQWIFINERERSDKRVKAKDFIAKMVPEMIPVFELRTSVIPKREATSKYLKVAEGTSFSGNYKFEGVEGEFVELYCACDFSKIFQGEKWGYRITLYGNDDTSYSKFFKSEEDYEREIDYLHFIAANTGVSIDFDITPERGYVFTN